MEDNSLSAWHQDKRMLFKMADKKILACMASRLDEAIQVASRLEDAVQVASRLEEALQVASRLEDAVQKASRLKDALQDGEQQETFQHGILFKGCSLRWRIGRCLPACSSCPISWWSCWRPPPACPRLGSWWCWAGSFPPPGGQSSRPPAAGRSDPGNERDQD